LAKIAFKIKQLRKDKGYSSYETFAVDNDLDRKQYWRIEKGANVTVATLLKILAIHQISMQDFFDDLAI